MIAVDEASNSILIEYIANYSSYFDLSMTFLATQNFEENGIIQLLIRELNILSAIPECNDSATSYLEIYDGSQIDSNLLMRACSADELLSYNLVTSTTRRLVVVLTLDEDFGFTWASFKARYKSFNTSANYCTLYKILVAGPQAPGAPLPRCPLVAATPTDHAHWGTELSLRLHQLLASGLMSDKMTGKDDFHKDGAPGGFTSLLYPSTCIGTDVQ
ncbi:hypothetical protein C0Q70_02887 [Pomacea canaliculata]|uniref:CUB domain-containing protein n=1 Tax=Pomacea canaliculata TaxID=400727 RepID=A0A2T7PR75_POMCA|nr:hypothetical protein C0Q70_02887 [Pomacea canaliculata]